MKNIGKKIKDFLDISFFCLMLALKASKKYFIIRIILEIITACIPFGTMFLGKEVINVLVGVPSQNNNINLVTYNFILLIVVLLVLDITNSVIQKVKEYCGGVHKDLIGREINEQIVNQSVSLDLSYFDSVKFYNEMNNARRDSNALETLTWFIVDMIRSGIQFVMSAVVLVALNPILAIIIIVTGIPSMLVEKSYTAKVYNWQRNRVPEERKMGYLTNILTGRAFAKDIRLFGIHKELLDRYNNIWHKWFQEKRDITFKQSKWAAVLSTLPQIATTSILVFVGIQIINGELTVGDYSLYSGMIGQLTSGLFSIIHLVSRLYDNNIRIDNYNKFIKWESNIHNTGKIIPDTLRNIEFQNVTFKYQGMDEYVLKNINFKINYNEKVALVGLNGAGKSTIIKLLLRFYEPGEGKILINGIDIKQYELKAFRKCFSVMFQDFVNYAFTLNENITISNLEAKDDETKIHDACVKSGLDTVLDKFDMGMDTYLTREFDEDGKELSGGQWQKVALARTFFRDGKIIILDEPSSYLDPEAEHNIFQKFSELCEGKSAFFISHRLSNVTMADRILVLDHGEIIEDGSHAELLKKGGKYAYLFNLQADKYKID